MRTTGRLLSSRESGPAKAYNFVNIILPKLVADIRRHFRHWERRLGGSVHKVRTGALLGF